MDTALITGSGGLIGAEAVRFFSGQGFQIVGIDNDMRETFFGAEASTAWSVARLREEIPGYIHHCADIREFAAVQRVFETHGTDIKLVIHAAAQPSHDWAAGAPLVDFGVNAVGTLNMLECSRLHCPEAAFIFTSTNKVYGDRPNALPLVEEDTRWSIDPAHEYAQGIPESMPVDGCLHSVFGASKVAADVMVQEYGRYFGLKTVCFRCGCLTGPGHSGAKLHGFLAYLMKCCVTEQPYTVFGYKGKQVRDNIHSFDLIQAFYQFYRNPRRGEVYIMGGGRYSNCSMQEAIGMAEDIAGNTLVSTYQEDNRVGDHMWWIGDLRKFERDYPEWTITYDVPRILQEVYAATVERTTHGERP
jgi:CDP-paratose 2-epimerase